jgi:hypothetical protein
VVLMDDLELGLGALSTGALHQSSRTC